MQKLLIEVDDDTYQDLEELSARKGAPIGRLLLYALDKTFEDDLDGIAGERALRDAMEHPGESTSLEDYLRERGIELPDEASSKRKERATRNSSGQRTPDSVGDSTARG